MYYFCKVGDIILYLSCEICHLCTLKWHKEPQKPWFGHHVHPNLGGLNLYKVSKADTGWTQLRVLSNPRLRWEVCHSCHQAFLLSQGLLLLSTCPIPTPVPFSISPGSLKLFLFPSDLPNSSISSLHSGWPQRTLFSCLPSQVQEVFSTINLPISLLGAQVGILQHAAPGLLLPFSF